jgi:hypothetical protein
MVLLWSAGWICAQEQALDTVIAVRKLTGVQTQQKTPVRLHGVVTFYDETLFSRFLQDETAGIYLQFPTNIIPPALMPGQVVEVTGVGAPGEYAPMVMVEKIEVTGKQALPLAKPVTYEQLASGVEDSQFVEVIGIVRSVRRKNALPNFLAQVLRSDSVTR